MSSTSSREINFLVVATVDHCLGPCDKCVGFYVDLTGKYQVNCSCQCNHQGGKT
jgi:hypothetical protein